MKTDSDRWGFVEIEMLLPTNRAEALLLLVLLAVILSACILQDKRNNRDLDTPEKVIQAYLTAMAAANRSQVQELIVPGRDAAAALDAKINYYGGVKLENIDLVYQPTESSHFFIVYLDADGIQADGDIIEIKDTLYVELYRGRWRLGLGTPRGLSPVSEPPAQTSPDD